jgi:hypothetical protein
MVEQQLVKVRFRLDASDWHGHGSETVWAAPVAGQDAAYRIANSPFFTKGVSHCDSVRALESDSRLVLDFERVLSRGGHSTYMLIVMDEAKLSFYWEPIETMGCSYESMHVDLSIGRRKLLSVDVPTRATLSEVCELLKIGESENVWFFQEGYAHVPGSRS